MPINGNLSWPHRLGIANCTTSDATGFGRNVLQLGTGGLPLDQQQFPVYQQQIVHSTAWQHGPAEAAGEWCSPSDPEYFYKNILREISAHDSVWSRRNLTNSVRFAWNYHYQNAAQQIYYLNNEPEFASRPVTPPGVTLADTSTCPPSASTNGCGCWNPRDWQIDSFVCSCFPKPNTTLPNPNFWDTLPAPGYVACASGHPTFTRVKAKALAYLFLLLKRITEGSNSNIVLPPSATVSELGNGTNDANTYFRDFYDYVRNGVTVGSCTQSGMSLDQWRVVHIHQYGYASQSPLQSVANGATLIRKGTSWLSNRYYSNQLLPLDVLLSEMGPDWNNVGPAKWAGGWNSMRTGLSWWNSWLCWLTLFAPSQCSLQSGRTVYGCVHEPADQPQTTRDPGHLTTNRNQFFVNTGTWNVEVDYGVTAINSGLAFDGRYVGTFSARDPILWGVIPGQTLQANWRLAPFGLCYHVWSKVGSQVTTGDLNTGWKTNTQAGLIQRLTIQLQPGYNTLFFPVFKDTGTFPQASQITIKWIKDDGITPVPYTTTYIDLNEIQDTGTFSANGLSQPVYSAMVWPAVCKAPAIKNVIIELWRNVSGPQIYVGKPVRLSGMWSWFVTQ